MRSFSLLVKPVGGDCNLDCRYCFYKYTHAKGRMTDALAARVVNTYMMLPMMEHAICFQGGEPMLMPLSFYEKLDLFGCETSIQTNGTLITDEWAEFFARNRWLVGISLDGTPEINEHFRQKTELVIKGIRLLEKYGVEFNILSVVSKANLGKEKEVGEYLRDNFAATRYQFIRCAEQVSLKEYIDFMSKMAEVKDLPMVPYHKPYCCGTYLAVEHDGSVYPCDFNIDEEHKLGNVMKDSWQALYAKGFTEADLCRCPQIR